MKRYLKVKWMIITAILFSSCKKELVVSPEYAKAYTRFVIIDAPGNGRIQFFLDGKVNANGDSVIHNPDGSLYQPDNAQYSTTTINYPSGGWTDNSPLNFPGTYGFNNRPGSTYATFPNPTDRIGLAPIINNYNYYNWAALPADQHQLSFYSVINSTIFGNPVAVRGDQFLNQSVNLEGGAVQTFFLLNKAVVKQYISAENNNAATTLPIYAINETVNYFSNQFDILSVKDHPDKLPEFKDSSAYIRFINITPVYADQSINQNTGILDVYIAPIYGLRPDIVEPYQGFHKLTDSVGQEILVTKSLERYQSTVDAPFFEINVAANMRKNKATGLPDTAGRPGRPRVPRYYRVLAYRSGQSAAAGNEALAQGDWLAVYNQYPGFDYGYANAPTGSDMVDSWLLRSDGGNYHPAICTIPIAIDQNLFTGENGQGAIRYLGFRACINYQKAGINSSLYQSKK